jgi:hypothetical protein
MAKNRMYRLTVAVTLAPTGPTYTYAELALAASLADAMAQVRDRHHRAYSVQFI